MNNDNEIESSMESRTQAASQRQDSMNSSMTEFWQVIMKVIPLYPPAEQEQKFNEIYQSRFKGKFPRMHAVVSFRLCQRQFIALHYRFARVVQPLGPILDPLAAPIGVLVLERKNCYKQAALIVSDKVIDALKNEDKGTLALIKKFFRRGKELHRNAQIWVAIEELTRERMESGTHATSQAAIDAGGQFPPMPSTSDIKRYVAERMLDPRFSMLPTPLDKKGWIRLWNDSGVDLEAADCLKFDENSMIPIGKRGKARPKKPN